VFSVKSGYLASVEKEIRCCYLLLGFKLDLYLSGRRRKDRRVTAKELETRVKASRVLFDAKLVAQCSPSLVKYILIVL